MFKKIKDFTITTKEKAVVGFLASAVGAYLVQAGVSLKDIHSKEAVYALIVGVVTHMFIYFTANTPQV